MHFLHEPSLAAATRDPDGALSQRTCSSVFSPRPTSTREARGPQIILLESSLDAFVDVMSIEVLGRFGSRGILPTFNIAAAAFGEVPMAAATLRDAVAFVHSIRGVSNGIAVGSARLHDIFLIHYLFHPSPLVQVPQAGAYSRASLFWRELPPNMLTGL